MKKKSIGKAATKKTDKTIEIKLTPGNYLRVKELSLKIIECFDNYSEEEVTYALANVESFRIFRDIKNLIDLKAKGLL